MKNDEFDKLFKYMEKRFDAVDDRLDRVDKRFDDLEKVVDGYARRADTYYQEMAALNAKVNRLEKWIEAVAKKTGVDLLALGID